MNDKAASGKLSAQAELAQAWASNQCGDSACEEQRLAAALLVLKGGETHRKYAQDVFGLDDYPDHTTTKLAALEAGLESKAKMDAGLPVQIDTSGRDAGRHNSNLLDVLVQSVRLDCQPKSKEDAVYVSAKWRDRLLYLVNSPPVVVAPTSLIDNGHDFGPHPTDQYCPKCGAYRNTPKGNAPCPNTNPAAKWKR